MGRSKYLASVLAGVVCLAGVVAWGQIAAGPEDGAAQYYSLPAVQESGMSAADAALLESRKAELLERARFFSYDLSSGSWTASEAFCPVMPDYMMMHFVRPEPNGAESLFTALVPRQQGRVEIIPVYYRSATPFHSAARSRHNYAIYNRVVPAAELPTNMKRNWLAYGACYAEMVGGPMSLLLKGKSSPRMMTVAGPAADVSETGRLTQIRFAARTARQHYDSWTLDLDKEGRLRKARCDRQAASPPYVNSPPAPTVVQMPEPPEPKAEVMHPKGSPAAQ
ncbi:hypothetical protein [Acidipila rosea]|uniref:Uncharacterized protein n=1 Tax=Acidipila rosea TaxID=768535 RepID=A0A4R1LFS7_9BACT|nr:hypothetical protein [Acidipila rosea]TCK75703.1 hypothetical protein C7378_0694 [Acidipila rosea]